MAGVNADPSVKEMSKTEHKQAAERHDIYEEGVDTEAVVEAARRRREGEE